MAKKKKKTEFKVEWKKYDAMVTYKCPGCGRDTYFEIKRPRPFQTGVSICKDCRKGIGFTVETIITFDDLDD